MDDPGVDPADHRAALAALGRVNHRLGVDRRLVRAIELGVGAAPARLLDIGTGGGGLLHAALEHAHRTGRKWQGCALDCSAFALTEARRGVNGLHAAYVAGDALLLPFADRSFDVVACSLLLHHFDPADAARLLNEAARVCRGLLLIGDLDRSRTAWLATWLVTRLTSRSYLFHVDGPRSVRAAYRPNEAVELAQEAGLAGAEIRRHFPFRWTLRWQRNGQ